MTNQELYTNYEILIDKSDTSAFQSWEFDLIANIALMSMIESKWKDLVSNIRYEQDQMRIIKHNKEYNDISRYLHEPISIIGAKTIPFTNIAQDVMFIGSIHSEMSLDCNSSVVKRWLYTRFVGEEERMKVEQSYWDGINDIQPKYTITETGVNTGHVKNIVILTDATPINVKVGYVRYPVKIDSTNNPNGIVDADDYMIPKLLKKIVSEGANIIEEYGKLSTINNDNIKIQ